MLLDLKGCDIFAILYVLAWDLVIGLALKASMFMDFILFILHIVFANTVSKYIVDTAQFFLLK